LLCALTTTGCATMGGQSPIQSIPVEVPVIYVPKPPVVIKPLLAINDIDENDAGDFAEIARKYKITIIQLLDYTNQLEIVVENYDDIYDRLIENNVIVD